ncbi:terminase family protein [bacterium]|nr:terminase family protein [bacterium]
MAEKDIKHLIRQEYLKCAKDPSHFMKKYCFIQHPQRGRIQFGLYPFQDKVLNVWKDNPYSMVLKSRQLGISTLASGYSLWLMTFHKDRNILALATTQATARNLISKIQFMWENLPSWLKVDAVENNKLSLRLSNGSKAQAKSSNADAARSEAVSLLIIDEAAFIDNIAETWASAQQTLATGGGAIVLSTPYGTGNWFHKMWVSAESQENDFIPIKLPWFVHPERDKEWRDKQDTLLGDPMLAAQECDCDFSTSGNTVFTSEWLEFIKTTTIQEPMERRGVDQNLWVWEAADYSRDYMIVADVARGDGKDFSGCHVMDVLTNTQVAEYKGQLPPKEFGYFLTGLATEYNNAMLVVENANIGWATLDAVQERGYRNLYHSPKGEKNDS